MTGSNPELSPRKVMFIHLELARVAAVAERDRCLAHLTHLTTGAVLEGKDLANWDRNMAELTEWQFTAQLLELIIRRTG